MSHRNEAEVIEPRDLNPVEQAAYDADLAAVAVRLAAAQATARGPVDPEIVRGRTRHARQQRQAHDGIRLPLDGILRW